MAKDLNLASRYYEEGIAINEDLACMIASISLPFQALAEHITENWHTAPWGVLGLIAGFPVLGLLLWFCLSRLIVFHPRNLR